LRKFFAELHVCIALSPIRISLKFENLKRSYAIARPIIPAPSTNAFIEIIYSNVNYVSASERLSKVFFIMLSSSLSCLMIMLKRIVKRNESGRPMKIGSSMLIM
jgi:hypothetical protein